RHVEQRRAAHAGAEVDARDRFEGRLVVFESVAPLLAEHEELQVQLADPAVHADAARSKRINRRYAELSRIKAAFEHWAGATDDLAAARELARDDEAFAAEVP